MKKSERIPRSNKPLLPIVLVLSFVTLAAFWQITQCSFTNYDDPAYVTENSNVQHGITLAGIRWAFTTTLAENWHPLTWLSHMLDVKLFGLKPWGHHLTNLLFHLANTLLLLLILYRMTNAPWQSAVVAALFALHPLHVESVAWVAERKDVLSAFFAMLSLGAYSYYVERPNLPRYLAVVFLFACGLMAKPMLVTLPFVLLLIDYWPLHRLRLTTSFPEGGTKGTDPVSRKKPGTKVGQKGPQRRAQTAASISLPEQYGIRHLVVEKIPLFVLAALSSIVTYLVQQKGGAVATFEAVPPGERITNAIVSYIAYLKAMIWPVDLTVLYPLPMAVPLWQTAGAVILLIAATVMVVRRAERNPYLVVGWLWYVGTLVPVIGIVQVGLQARADRYTYLPLIGIFIMAAWGIAELTLRWKHRRRILMVSSAIIFLCLFFATRNQVSYWQDSITLFGHAIQVTERNYTAYYNRGTALAKRGDYEQAIRDYDMVIEINPAYKEAYNNRGNAYAAIGSYRQAIQNYDKAIEINPNNTAAYNNRGNAFLLLGDNNQAIQNYDKAIEIDPNYAEAYNNRAHAYSNLGNNDRAIEDFKTSARLGYLSAQNRLKSRGIDW
jgi:hypothetical protein